MEQTRLGCPLSLRSGLPENGSGGWAGTAGHDLSGRLHTGGINLRGLCSVRESRLNGCRSEQGDEGRLHRVAQGLQGARGVPNGPERSDSHRPKTLLPGRGILRKVPLLQSSSDAVRRVQNGREIFGAVTQHPSVDTRERRTAINGRCGNELIPVLRKQPRDRRHGSPKERPGRRPDNIRQIPPIQALFSGPSDAGVEPVETRRLVEAIADAANDHGIGGEAANLFPDQPIDKSGEMHLDGFVGRPGGFSTGGAPDPRR
jgi:hypothetical protein